MKRKALLAAAVFLFAGVSGCAHKTEVQSSTALPAALGEAQTSLDDNGNTRVRLVLNHVAPPQNLQPPKNTYVVWVETPDKQMYNLGQLKIDEDRNGKLTGITPLKVFRLVVTAEDYGTAQTPSSQVVLTTKPIEAK
ncbi:hypothetical protein LPW11_07995 [Geomonas sp. RF6]|uniref:hypothetical protein n=1 Tax=Geomonas sp. RF6 TaxID=2897342 RepID=UPI001E2C2512|nr:hypothetical protein [Geomonas sp. RF6]UFS72120.1 hypothetical protein LPW11_07995 [Geomonas sp. RF6]